MKTTLPKKNTGKFKLQKYGFKSEKEFSESLHKMQDSGLSQNQICKQLKCSKLTIIKAFKKFKLSSNYCGYSYKKSGFKSEEDMIKEFKKFYNAGLSLNNIARSFNLSTLSVLKYFKKYDIERRENSEALGARQKDIKLSQDEIEILNGILIGNASLKRKKYTASIRYVCAYRSATDEIIKKFNNITMTQNTIVGYKDGSKRWNQLKSMSYRCLASVYDLWYKEGEKYLPENTILTPESCYWLYVGDGAIIQNSLRLSIRIHKSNIDLLVSKLPMQIGWVYTSSYGFPIIHVGNKAEILKFFEFIGPYRHEEYRQKWDITATSRY